MNLALSGSSIVFPTNFGKAAKKEKESTKKKCFDYPSRTSILVHSSKGSVTPKLEPWEYLFHTCKHIPLNCINDCMNSRIPIQIKNLNMHEEKQTQTCTEGNSDELDSGLHNGVKGADG